MEPGADTIARYRATAAADRSGVAAIAAPAGLPTDLPTDLKLRLRAHARELGLADLGFTTVEPLPRGGFYEQWLAEGRAATMHWLKPGERGDPAALLPGAQTLIVAAAKYARSASEPAPIAAYAQRDDYHRLLKNALRAISAELRALLPGSTTRVAVDTAPLREREAAMRSGLGWIGKNTMLVHLQHGCYTLLGEILWSGTIEPDPPAVDHCGECRRCLDACPTGAFPQAYEIDARRCLSYWTIEQRGPIPEELRAAQSTRAFGCDACLAACPFGGRALFDEGPLLPTRAPLARRSLRELIELARDRFWKTFRTTPVERARRRGMLRNLLVAAGNSGDASLLDVVAPFRDDPEPMIADHARAAVARLANATEPAR